MSDTPSTDGVRRIDLDAARAARREKLKDKEPTVIIFQGREFPVPDELPASVFESITDLQGGNVAGLTGTLESLLGKETYAEIKAIPDLTFDDLFFLVNSVVDSFGLSLGE